MKQALEVLEQINQLSIGENAIALPGEIDAAMDNLRAAIEQAEKPMAWFHADNYKTRFTTDPSEEMVGKYWKPLYTAPRQWVELTDEEISEARDTAAVEFRKNQYRVRGQMFMPSDSLEWWLARAVETKLKEKNSDPT